MNYNIINKSYDIRWIYPSEINEEYYYKLGFAFGVLQKNTKTFVVWCDSRLSSDSLKQAIISWLLDSWKYVIDAWLCSTDMIYFASWRYSEVDIWIMITASHNPKEYNWLKSCYKNAAPINMKIFWNEIINFLQNNSIEVKIISQEELYKNAYYSKKDISDDFVDHVTSFIEKRNIKPLKIVADAGNWVAWVFTTKICDKLGIELIPMFFEPDGNFPNHHPSPIEPENVEMMIKKVIETNSDLWVAFDWDADRMYICDEKWEILSWTITTAMIAEMILKKNPWKKIIYNAVSWNIVPDIIKTNNWVWIRSKVGHVYIKELMNLDQDIVFWWEHSGHYYFRNNWNADSWIIAFVVALELISKSWKKPSEVREEFEKYFAIPETNSKVTSVPDKLAELKEVYKDWIQDEFDWLTVRFSDYWFNVRPSSNEPLLRLNVEANSKDLLKEKTQELLNIIRS